MKTAQYVICFGLMASASLCAAESFFTESQQKEIQRLFQAEREVIRQEILAEIEQGHTGHCATEAQPQPEDSEVLVNVSEVVSPSQLIDSLPDAGQPISAYFLGQLANSMFDRSTASDKSGFELEGSTASSRASIKVGKQLSDWKSTDTGTFSNIKVTASAPLDKKDKDFTNVATLDGFTNAFKLSLDYSKFVATGISTPLDSQGDYRPEYVIICKLVGIDVLKTGEGAPKKNCDTNTVKTGLQKIDRMDVYPKFKSLFWSPNAWKWTYGATASVGFESFDYFEQSSLSKKSSDEIPWELGIFGGFIPPGHNSFFTFGLSYQQAYKTASVKTFCPISTDQSPLECVTGKFGIPADKEKHLAYIDARSMLKSIGYSLRLTHDFENDETGVDLPIYILKDKDGNLNGGIRLGWTDTDDFSVGVFVGSTFRLFK